MKTYDRVRLDDVVVRLGAERLTEAKGIGRALAEKIVAVCVDNEIDAMHEIIALVDGLGDWNSRDLHDRLYRALGYLNGYDADNIGVGTTRVFAVLVDGEVKALSVATQVTTTGPYLMQDYKGEYVEYPEDMDQDYFNLYELAHSRVRAYAMAVRGVVKTLDLEVARKHALNGVPYAVYSPA